MKRKIIISICLLLTLFVGSVVAQRIRKHGGLVDVSRAGAVLLTPKAGQAVTVTGAITASGIVTGSGLNIGNAQIIEAELEQLDSVTPGTVSASKAVVVDSNKDITGFRHITHTGLLNGVKRYVALLTQTSTNAPTATVLENSLGGTVVWTRNGVGDYTGTLAGAFPVNKTLPSYGKSGTPGSGVFRGARATDNTFQILVVDVSGDPVDGLTADKVEIVVYP